MLASGLPEKSSVHAKSIALVALDMLDIAREITVDGEASVKVNLVYSCGGKSLEIFYDFACVE